MFNSAEEFDMGHAVLEFDPRKNLKEFSQNKATVSLIRRIGGKKSSKNMLIHGENLATLAALKAGSGTSGSKFEVDIITIDPPYNVGGNQGYKNTWKGKSEKERDWAEDHGEFLDFMEPRLKIGKSLLKDDGVIFLNISDGEYCRLKILMDQIFGPENCLGTIIWNKTQGAYGKHLTTIHEYILVYAKDAKKAPRLKKDKESALLMIEKAKSLKDKKLSHKEAKNIFNKWVKDSLSSGIIGKSESYYNQLHPDTFEPFQATSMSAQDNPDKRSKLKLKHPITGKPCKVPPMGWKYSEGTLKKMYKFEKIFKGEGFIIAGEIRYGLDENTIPRQAFLLSQGMTHAFPTMIHIPHNAGKSDLPKEIKFTTPKPVKLIKELIKSYPNREAIILDYFAGSGTAAQAAYEQNQEDGGNRSWIMVEEMGSTFYKVLMPRIERFQKDNDFGVFELQEVKMGIKKLIEAFQEYSFDFLSAYHQLNEECTMTLEGMSILGFDEKNKQVVAMTLPQFREGKYFFEEELSIMKDAIKRTNAKRILIYTIKRHDRSEEPWLGVDKSILIGTSCKDLQIVEIPDQLIEEWNEVLTAMAA